MRAKISRSITTAEAPATAIATTSARSSDTLRVSGASAASNTGTSAENSLSATSAT